MIKEDYVSYETAKLLKEKGFDGRCHMSIGKYKQEEVLVKGAEWDDSFILCPTLQMAMKWLREKEWFICIIPLAFHWGEKAVKFGYDIWADDDLEVDEVNTPEFNTYEEACESAINYCLKNL